MKNFVLFALLLTLASGTLAADSSNISKLSPPAFLTSFDAQSGPVLVFYALPASSFGSATSVVEVKIYRNSEYYLLERFAYTPGKEPLDLRQDSTSPVVVFEFLAASPKRLASLQRMSESRTVELKVEILVNSEVVAVLPFSEFVQASEAAMGDSLPVATQAQVTIGSRLTTPIFEGPCEDYCDLDLDDCLVDACYWEYDEYMCQEGCDLEYDCCLADCNTNGCATTTRSHTYTVELYRYKSGRTCIASNFFAPGNAWDRYTRQMKRVTVTTTKCDQCITNESTSISYFQSGCFVNLNRGCAPLTSVGGGLFPCP